MIDGRPEARLRPRMFTAASADATAAQITGLAALYDCSNIAAHFLRFPTLQPTVQMFARQWPLLRRTAHVVLRCTIIIAFRVRRSRGEMYTVSPKMRQVSLAVTRPKLNESSKFFHC